MRVFHNFLNQKVRVGLRGGYYIRRKRRKIYLKYNNLTFEETAEPLFKMLPEELERLILSYLPDESAWYRFLLSLTPMQRKKIIVQLASLDEPMVSLFPQSVDIAMALYPETNRIYQKALSQINRFLL